MEGMDLWTSMFSSDFEEGEPETGEAELEESEQYGNDNDDFPGDSEILEAGDAIDDLLDGEEGDREEEEEDYGDGSKGAKPLDPDDDALFDFDMEPIVNIAETQPSVLTPAGPMAPQVRPPMQRHSVPGSQGRPRLNPGLSIRPTTSQINATDENGVPINYELGVVYICPACGGEFRQQDHWKRHMNHIHKYNTLRGLNFTPLDKLYQRCKECNKRIAMHSRENLLKHKFTHLPFRCTKCYICKREYKYRQDLMVHLRMVHCDEVVAMMREGYNAAGRKTRVRESRVEQMQREKSFHEENDFTEDLDRVEVRNEVLEPDADELGILEQPFPQEVAKKKSTGMRGAAELCEDYIHYMCPDCGTECDTHAQWSQHIEFVHDYVSRRGLNFRSVDMQMQCLECKKIVIPNTIKSLRAHKFSHLSQPEWLRCKLCYKGYTDHQEVIRHLLQTHHMNSLLSEDAEEEDPAVTVIMEDEDVEDNGNGEGNGTLLDEDSPYFEDAPRRGGRISSDDIYEPHIDYLCPQCGKEFIEKKHWRTHVVMAHNMNDLSKLNFAMINERQLQCTECEKVITNAYGIQNAQQHRITHLPFKAYARCRKCHKSYTDRKGLVKHLATHHRVGCGPRKSAGGSAGPASMPTPPKQPRRQIVTVANETYEIIYLDDVEQSGMEDENDIGEQMQAEEEDYPIALPEPPPPPPPSTSQASHHRYKCVHCGSLFPTQAAVRVHISEKRCRKTMGRRHRQAVANADPSAATVEQNYIFLCPSCGMEYKTQFEWRRHINEVHNFDKRQYLNMRQLDKYRYQCTQCKDIVCNSKLKGLQDHHFRHLPYRLYLKCLICGTCYNHKPNIAAHLRARHSIYDRENPLKIAKPKHAFGRYKEGSREKPRVPTPPQAAPSPPGCSSSAASAASSQRSLKPQPGGLPTRPAGLNTLEDSISYHNAVDLDFITYFCPKCNQNFDSHAFWRKHIVEQHNFNSREGLNFRQIDNHHYLCLECYKRVTVTHTKGAIGQLQSHKFRHLPHRSFKCLTCDGEFVRKQMFFKHLNRDTNRCDNRPHRDLEEDDPDQEPSLRSIYQLACPQCGDNFTTRSMKQWREHINDYHGLTKLNLLHMTKIGEDLYRCQDCNEELQTSRQWVLQFHRIQHLPHAAYIRCKLCKKSSEAVGTSAGELHSLRELQQHLRKHHPALGESEMALLRDQIILEEKEQEEAAEVPAEEEENQAGQESGPYMPLPPHLLDESDDVEFEDQYLLG
ncbi:zinc finger protein Xfin [Drosophila ficusphila]|uniref:zinc finger protein Xfin n=1 Tax=Drosophila ficusphila TaxID=30025 RepID=UPI0007E84950|nr:zinc finger protein Xfin [Drosophila ficusphila]